MAELTAKERIIKEVYENREQGYGSIKAVSYTHLTLPTKA